MNKQKELGQFFTTSEDLQQFVFDKVKYKGKCLLEPSFGKGHLLKRFLEFDPNYPMICCEIDESIEPIVQFNEKQDIYYEDFTELEMGGKFKTIIGNPPYKKTGTGNLYIKFAELCFELLKTNGELIFIVPSDFTKLTRASRLIQKMVDNGSFTDFFFPENEKLFDGASIDVVVFRYEKDLKSNRTLVNNEEMFYTVNDGIITFNKNGTDKTILLSRLFDVYVGLVSGREDVYKVSFGNIEVLNGEDKTERYLMIDEFPSGDEEIDEYLESKKEILMSRKIRKFNDENWFEWGAPRNRKIMENKAGDFCIYLKNMTRKNQVAFVGTVQYFGGSLLCLIPRIDITEEQLHLVVDYLNSDEFQENYIYAERFKIGQKQTLNANIPLLFDVEESNITYEETKEAILEGCSGIKLKFSSKRDGRVDSSLREKNLIEYLVKFLKEKFEDFVIDEPQDRCWYDIMINDIPINIKITEGNTADNAFTKQGILFTVSGKTPETSHMNFNRFAQELEKINKKKSRDLKTEYHYLVFYKNTGEILFKSILDIYQYKSNPSNQLQIHWGNELKHIEYLTNDFLEKIIELLATVQESEKQNAENSKDFREMDITDIFQK
jgi:adenine-specific DNA-methyltransferase